MTTLDLTLRQFLKDKFDFEATVQNLTPKFVRIQNIFFCKYDTVNMLYSILYAY